MKSENTNTRKITLSSDDNGGSRKNQVSWMAAPMARPEAGGYPKQPGQFYSTITVINNLKKFYPFRSTILNPQVQDYLQYQLYHATKISF